ncbi:MAG: hypothetical protein HXX08_23125 [Chloroflexi bacterium]|uniref:Uncharacterized protein n=1 Tax=Candidatus Chlorohelix allophototropha TaxID=3003348 RepID=A0A8T7MA12_9CHLR|nr:hypothetical protein [Chloroflexota bacterium]WJW68697.1 hypothetical protein OZ401_004313 [Chloroflexota bacterium L227-S17]
MRVSLALILLFGLSLLLGACGEAATLYPPTPTIPATTPTFTIQVPVPPKPKPAPGWEFRWLQDTSCTLPCYEGITPGKTSAEEAMTLLQQNPLVSAVSIGYFEGDAYGFIAWDWVDAKKRADGSIGTGGYIQYDATKPTRTIYSISPALPQVPLKEVIKRYGYPTHVIAPFSWEDAGRSLYYYLYLIYQPQGLILYNKYYTKEPPINEDISFGKLSIVNPDYISSQQKLYGFPADPSFIVPWEGFKDFRYYCRMTDKGQIVKCDSVLDAYPNGKRK